MHKESLEQMALNIKKYLSPTSILDVGSLNYKNRKGILLGCYKTIVPIDFNYTGIDLVPGDNVDIVMGSDNLYSFPVDSNSYGAVITGQCFEHVPNPFKLMKECVRVLRPGGYFIGVAPYKWELHRVPVDCWRIQPDGWHSLFEEGGLQTIDIYINEIDRDRGDCWGIAKK